MIIFIRSVRKGLTYSMEIDSIIFSPHPTKHNSSCLYGKSVKTHSMEVNNIYKIAIPGVRLEKNVADQ